MLAERRPLIISRSGDMLRKSAFDSAWQRFIRLALEDKAISAEERFGLHDLKRKGITDTKEIRGEKQIASRPCDWKHIQKIRSAWLLALRRGFTAPSTDTSPPFHLAYWLAFDSSEHYMHSQPGSHFADRFIVNLGKRRVAIPLFALCLMNGAALGLSTGQWEWLDRFAGVGTIFGLILMSTAIFSGGVYKHQANSRVAYLADDDGTVPVSREDRINGSRIFAGILLSMLGAILNQFGSVFDAMLWV